MSILANHPAVKSDNPPTEKQLAIAEFIVRFTIAKGFSPALQDICTEFGFASKTAAAGHIEALRKKSVLVGDPTTNREEKKESRGLVVVGFAYGDIFEQNKLLANRVAELEAKLVELTPAPAPEKPKRRTNAKK
jgi:SOS-response transcriptional repressor LexA